MHLIHERVDDIALLLGVIERLKLAEQMDAVIGSHGNPKGLSNGTLAGVWIAFLLSEGDHRKSSVQEWVDRHRQLLERFFGQPFRSVELNDDRLGIVLEYLSDTERWEDLEKGLWSQTMSVVSWEIQEEMEAVRLDSTTT